MTNARADCVAAFSESLPERCRASKRRGDHEALRAFDYRNMPLETQDVASEAGFFPTELDDVLVSLGKLLRAPREFFFLGLDRRAERVGFTPLLHDLGGKF